MPEKTFEVTRIVFAPNGLENILINSLVYDILISNNPDFSDYATIHLKHEQVIILGISKYALDFLSGDIKRAITHLIVTDKLRKVSEDYEVLSNFKEAT